MRLAGDALKAIGNALKFIKPTSSGEALMRFGPEILYAGLAAGSAPEGTPLAQRLLVGGEDLAIGLGPSALGQLGGYGLGRKMVARGRDMDQLSPEELQKFANYVNIGDFAAGPLNIAAPRPAMNKMYSDLRLEQEQIQQAQIEQAMQEREQALIQALLGGGSALLR